jgi:hypothetical protein
VNRFVASTGEMFSGPAPDIVRLTLSSSDGTAHRTRPRLPAVSVLISPLWDMPTDRLPLRQGQPLTFAVADLNDFKRVNDL